ncbi:hypothetical protein RRG08_035419 [Elysia crispata]|uniref:Sulfotransferase domain-containing protein n=1 Tax=Elysia crispata TaxID=231223 RepID=A0AAE0Y501_9GAST|nr:hypothetical protein RRG08_035419 [Elysia crispata]
MISTVFTSRKSKAIAIWCGVLLLVLCFHFYVSYQRVELPGIGRSLYGDNYRDPPPYNQAGDAKTIKRPTGPKQTTPPAGPKQLYTPPKNEEKKQRFPKALIVGTGKCGTRALIDYLNMHPYVTIAKREMHFFDRDENWSRGYNWYKSQMPRSYSNQMTIEKSPSYVEHPRTPSAVRRMSKDTYILWVVKDPVVRLMSVMALQDENSNLRHAYLEYSRDGKLQIRKEYYPLWRGEYVIHLRRWLRYFPLAQIHVLDGTDLVKDPVTQIQQVESFLQLPPLLGPRNFYFNASKGFYCMVPFSTTTPQCLGSSKGRKHPVINDTVKTMLYDFFRPYNEQFFKLLGKRFNWEPKERV